MRTHFRADPDGENVTAARVEKLLASEAPEDRRTLRMLADRFVAEYEFEKCGWEAIPESHSLEKDCAKPRVVVHSFGAIRCLERLLGMLGPGGFILMNDYGSADARDDESWFEHQRYSGATFVGVNFGLLKRHFATAENDFIEPAEGSEQLFSRLLGGRGLPGELIEKFRTLFAKKSIEEQAALKAQAKGYLGSQRYEAALSVFRRVLEQQPYDWLSLSAVAELLTFGLREPAAGLSAIREALAINPTCSSNLSDIAGECLLELRQPYEARKAFVRASEVNPDDVRARYGLANVHCANKDWDGALEEIAGGLAGSHDAKWSQQLLNKQAEILGELDRSRRESHRRLANRIRQVGSPNRPVEESAAGTARSLFRPTGTNHE